MKPTELPEVPSPARVILAVEQCVVENHREDALDEALAETFPSSDPIAISITRHHEGRQVG
jgi:hypothetical protein